MLMALLGTVDIHHLMGGLHDEVGFWVVGSSKRLGTSFIMTTEI